MRKLFTLILVIVMAFSVVALSACGKKDDEAGNSSEAPKSFDFSSSSSVISRSRVSASPSATQSASQSQQQSDSNYQSDINSQSPYVSNSQSQYVSNSQSQYTSQSTDIPYSISSISIDSSISINARAVIYSINNIGSVEYSIACEQKILLAETSYNQLTSTEKSEVSNYSSLTAARAAYDSLAAAASQVYVDQFKAAVMEITTFEYSAAYKSKLDNCDTLYTRIVSSMLSSVSSEKSKLEAQKTLYSNTTTVNEFMTIYNALPGVDNITNDTKGNVQVAVAKFSALTSSQTAMLTDYSTISTTMATYKTNLQAKFPVIDWIRDRDNDNFGAYSISSSSSQSNTASFPDGKSYSKARHVKTGCKITFSAPYGGELKMYARYYNTNKSCSFTVSLGGAIIKEATSISEAEVFSVVIPNGGVCTIDFVGECNVYALIFS